MQTHHFALKYANAVDVLTEIHEYFAVFQDERPAVRDAKRRFMLDKMASVGLFDKGLIIDTRETALLEHSCNEPSSIALCCQRSTSRRSTNHAARRRAGSHHALGSTHLL